MFGLCVILVSHLQVLLDFSEGVEGVSLRAGPREQGLSAVVVYASHHAASMAKKVLIEGRPGFSWRFSVLISIHSFLLAALTFEMLPSDL